MWDPFCRTPPGPHPRHSVGTVGMLGWIWLLRNTEHLYGETRQNTAAWVWDP